MSPTYPRWVDTMQVDRLEESECNAPPHFGTPFDPLVELDRENERGSMQMLLWLGLAALAIWCLVIVTALRS